MSSALIYHLFMWIIESRPFDYKLCILAPISLNANWFIIAKAWLTLKATFTEESVLVKGCIIFAVFIHVIEMNVAVVNVVDVNCALFVWIKRFNPTGR